MQTSSLRLALAASVLLFATEQLWAQTPVITSVTPGRNTRAATRNTNVAATLSQAFPAGATLNVFGSQAGGKKTGTTAVSGNTVTFDPSADFKPGELVTAVLNTTSTPNLAHVWQFTAAATGGAGTFGPTIITNNAGIGNSEVGDIDGDGDLDVLSAGTQVVNIYRNTGTGQFPSNSPSLLSISNLVSMKLGDVDGDGDLDILATNVNISTIRYRVTLYRNNGTGTFTADTSTDVASTVSYVSPVTLGDIDGDGDLDLLYSLSGGSLQVVAHLNNGTGTFGTPLVQTTASTARIAQLMPGDVDNDGDLDIISISLDTSGQVGIYLNNGTGALTASANYPASNYRGGMAVGDIDGDGDLDVAVPTFEPNSVVNLLLNNGNGTFVAGPAIPAGSAGTTVALGDVNGDGNLDLAVSGVQVSVLLNRGGTTFTANPTVTLGSAQVTSLQLVDMDGDGDLDIAGSGGGFLYVAPNQNTVTSNKPSAETAFQVWPNPVGVSTNLHISLPSGVSAAEAKLHTLLGQPVRKHTFSGSTTELATEGLASGVYLLTVQPVGQAPTTRRIVLE